VFDDGQTRLGKEALHHVLVHAGRGAEDAGTDVGDAGEFKETLDGAVLAEGAVKDGKYDVEGLAAQAFLWMREVGEPGSGASSVGMPS
jgi:hypothetical protein